jgi:aminoglycoside 6-adenylyltransferase
VPNARIDVFTDYDLILIVDDIHPYHEQRGWLTDFGTVLMMYRDPIMHDGDFVRSGNIVQYEDGLKIDFTLMPVGLLRRIASEEMLPDEFDAGYRVLIDKDGLTEALKAPAYQAYIPKPPTEAEYLEHVEVFFVDATYVAKYLWRDDVIAAKEVLDHFLKQEHLLPMLWWHVEIAHGWTVKPGPIGRGLKRWLRPDLWQALESTYADAEIEANWDALFNAVALFRQAAVEVGDALGFAYTDELHERAVAYLRKVKGRGRFS